MPEQSRSGFDRRNVLKSSLAMAVAGVLGRTAEAREPAIKNVNPASSPSTLKITDMRYAVVVKPGPSPCVLIRIDTNQGVYGLGEVAAGDEITLLSREQDSVSISEILRLFIAKDLAVNDVLLVRRALVQNALPDSWKQYFHEKVSRSALA